MREATNHFIGTHDLSASVNSSRNDGMANPVKMGLFTLIIHGALLLQEVEGSGFMYKTSAEKHDSAKYTLSAPPHLTGCLVAVRCNEEHLRLPSGCPTTSLGRHHSIRLKTCLLPKHLQGAREGNENCSILKIECNSTLLLKN
uniref:Uncharacterized protein n=1 Tax=Populus trichocarpa TaxID=3694 RepID=A0A2K1YLR7_POPTR